MLDAFARQGLKFTRSAHAAAPVCTPTRCAYITGRYPQRLPVGLEEPLTADSPPDVGLPPEHPTIASLLKANGYDTSLVGKWHLGWKPEFGPNRHGFDEFFGMLSGAADYFTHRSSDAAGAAASGRTSTPIERVGYLTDLCRRKRSRSSLGRTRTVLSEPPLHGTARALGGPEDQAIGHTTHGAGPMIEGGSLKIYAR